MNQNNSSNKVAIVTGSSRGIGFETSLILARSGFYTYTSMRNLDNSKKIVDLANKEQLPLQTMQLGVTDDKSVKDAINKVVEENGRVDVLVNNAGYSLTGAFEDLAIDEIRAQFETNFFGVVRVTQAVLPIMRKQGGGGRIVNISSIGGLRGSPIISAYHSTKFALEGLSESMAYEVEPYGIKVVLIEPSLIRTNMLNASVRAKKAQDSNSNSPYFQLMQNVLQYFTAGLKNGTPAQEVAKKILHAVTDRDPKLRYKVGW